MLMKDGLSASPKPTDGSVSGAENAKYQTAIDKACEGAAEALDGNDRDARGVAGRAVGRVHVPARDRVAEDIGEVGIQPRDRDHDSDGDEEIHEINGPVNEEGRIDDITVGSSLERRNGRRLNAQEAENNCRHSVAEETISRLLRLGEKGPQTRKPLLG